MSTSTAPTRSVPRAPTRPDGRSGAGPHPVRRASYELFMLLVSILAIANIAVELWPGFDPASSAVIYGVDVVLALPLALDFVLRLAFTHPRRHYLVAEAGWADLVAIVPVPGLRLFRIVRIVAAMRYFGAMGGRRVIRELLRDTASSAFALTIFLVLVVLELTGALIVAMEAGNPGANIQTAGDALWWGIVTITTVGYGDRYPVTGEGRLVGTFLLTAGIILFSVLTGFLTRQFFSPRDVSAAAATGRVDDAAPEGGDDARARIAALVALLDDQDQRQSVIRARLAELERMLEGAADRPPASA